MRAATVVLDMQEMTVDMLLSLPTYRKIRQTKYKIPLKLKKKKHTTQKTTKVDPHLVLFFFCFFVFIGPQIPIVFQWLSAHIISIFRLSLLTHANFQCCRFYHFFFFCCFVFGWCLEFCLGIFLRSGFVSILMFVKKWVLLLLLLLLLRYHWMNFRFPFRWLQYTMCRFGCCCGRCLAHPVYGVDILVVVTVVFVIVIHVWI